jgi:hypothetical protein
MKIEVQNNLVLTANIIKKMTSTIDDDTRSPELKAFLATDKGNEMYWKFGDYVNDFEDLLTIPDWMIRVADYLLKMIPQTNVPSCNVFTEIMEWAFATLNKCRDFRLEKDLETLCLLQCHLGFLTFNNKNTGSFHERLYIIRMTMHSPITSNSVIQNELKEFIKDFNEFCGEDCAIKL